MNKIKKIVGVSSLLLVFVSGSAWADDQNYQNYMVGDRAAGMGGAYTAISDTAEGTFYNPAGLVFTGRDSISLSASIFRSMKGTLQKAVLNGQGDLPVNATEFLPISTVFTKVFAGEKNAMGISLYVPDSNLQVGTVSLNSSTLDAFVSYRLTNRTYLLGPSYARKFADNFSIGASVYSIYRVYEQEIFSRVEEGTVFDQDYILDQYSFVGLLGDLGVKWEAVRDFHLGLSVRSPALKLLGSGSQYRSSRQTDSSIATVADGSDVQSESTNETLLINLRNPLSLRVGAAYYRQKNWALSTDVSFYFPGTFTVVHNAQTGADSRLRQDFVTNVNMGGEYYLTPSWPLRAGFFTNFSSAPALGAGSTLRVNYYGPTLGVGHEGENSTITLTGQLAFGFGELLAAGTANDFKIYNVTLMLGGDHRF